MMKPGFFLPLAVLSALSVGCNHSASVSGTRDTPYHRIEAGLTREAQFFGLEKVRYLTSIVYKARPLREAYVEEYTKRYAISPVEKENLLKRELEEAETFDVFLVSHFATDRDVAKVTKEAKVWRISLIQDGNEAEPLDPDSVTSLANDDRVLRYFYPQVNHWSKVFLVKFKRRGDPTSLKLRMVGVVADLSFDWQLKN
jgi:hypothetical protein